MAKWHTVEAQKATHFGVEREFIRQGPLVSIGREPPQNSTDNRLDESKPVTIRYSIKKIMDTKKLRKYFPQNPWIDHLTSGKNKSIIKLDSDINELIDDGIDVLLIEDYNCTGLVGNPSQMFPHPKPGTDDEYDDESVANTFMWFMRVVGESKPTGGKGGSWGLGKFAIPLASSVRTFFCVTTQESSELRHLAGQSHLNLHYRHGTPYDGILYYAQDRLKDKLKSHSWLPVVDSNEIDEFCDLFGVKRNTDQPGTSFIIPLPRTDAKEGASDLKNIALCVVANYAVPIMDGLLDLEFQDNSGEPTVFNAGNIKKMLKEANLPWDLLKPTSKYDSNPAWTSQARMKELVELRDARVSLGEDVVQLNLNRTSPGLAPTSQFSSVIPDQESEEFIIARTAFHSGKFVYAKGKMAVNKLGIGTDYGEYSIVLRKCDEEAAEAHFYRDQISLPLVNSRNPVANSVSSLLVVKDKENPLDELLRQSEGPAHLYWDAKEERLKAQYEYGPTTINFLRDIGKRLVEEFNATSSESEETWADIFNLGVESGGKKPGTKPHPSDPLDIRRNFAISEIPTGFTIEPREGCEDLTGRKYILRVGYPKVGPPNPAKAPDPRRINVHELKWTPVGAEIFFDVPAQDTEICVDRVRVVINRSDFIINLEDLDPRLKGQLKLDKESDLHAK